MRPLGSGRDGLFNLSSRIASGRRWLAILKTRRLDQTRRRIEGMRLRTVMILGEALVLRVVPATAPKTANKVVGSAKVKTSVWVKRWSVWMKLRRGRKGFCFSTVSLTIIS